MKLDLELQNPFDFKTTPESADCTSWVESALITLKKNKKYTVLIRFVDEQEGLELNYTYRNKNNATNVLSFPSDMPDFSADFPELADEVSQRGYLGDLVLCEPIVQKEALEQNKEIKQHWAHLIIHGTLHLVGYDHLNDTDAEIMETLEIQILKSLGFENPYNASET